MAKRKKKKTKAKNKKQEQNSNAPEGFWQQAVAFVLGAVIAPLLLLAMFGFGGSLPVGLFDAAQWSIGQAAYLAPFVLIFISAIKFRAEDHKLPRSSFWGVVLFLMSLTGLLHLMIDREAAAEIAADGGGGGMLGHLTDSVLFPVLDIIGTVVVLLGVGILSLLFILKVPVKSFILALLKPFRRSKDKAGEGTTDAAEPVKGDSHFQLNEGVPIEKQSGRSSFKDTAQKLSSTEDHEALTTVSDPDWKLPGLDLLINKQDKANPGDIDGNAELIKDTLSEFNIPVEMEGANVGPRVTQYTLRPPAGVRLSKITSLDNNLSLTLAAEAIRIEAPIPGKRAVGIEVPNQKAATVRVHGVLSSKEWDQSKNKYPLSFVIGRDIAGNAVVADLSDMPHLLVAGQTGSGKSVMINALLTSLLYRNSPSDLKMIMVDPKRVELKPFDEIPHLLTPVITESEKTISALKWAVAEMERRYQTLSEAGRRSILEYNKSNKEESMPYIVIVIDELADLMMMAARDVEALVVRLAQKARAVGVHLVLATQRPSVDVITGLIKANVPGRIAFTTQSQIDSRTIIDQGGAEKLLGKGDMLFKTPQMPKPKRLQGAFIETEEVERVTDFVRMQRAPEYDDEVVSQPVNIGGGGVAGSLGDAEDSLFEDAVRLVIDTGQASTSYLQRRFSIGYTRAAKLMDMMEEKGIVAQAQGNKKREVLVSSEQEVFGDSEEPGV